jgi:hypothetical protein
LAALSTMCASTSDADIALIAAAPTPWQEWRADHFTPANLANLTLSGSTPDPDKDGIENLMEYALSLNPKTPAPLSQRIANDLDSNQYLRLTIAKNPNATDVLYSVEVSSDLTTWSTTDVVILQNTATMLQVRDTQAMSAANRRFMRLRVTQP